MAIDTVIDVDMEFKDKLVEELGRMGIDVSNLPEHRILSTSERYTVTVLLTKPQYEALQKKDYLTVFENKTLYFDFCEE
jgi:hypothetical protein